MNLEEWAARWNVPPEALAELAEAFRTRTREPAGSREVDVVNLVRLHASEAGWTVFRNNVGACYDQTGRFIRYGLANDSEKLNAQVKSSDIVGIRPIVIDPTYLGRTVGQFVAIECKRPGWEYAGTAREAAQLKFLTLIATSGGYARFSTGGI